MRPLPLGTDGIRGRAGRWPVTAAVARQIGAAAAGRGRVLCVTDTRPSSASLAGALLYGVSAHGGEAQRGGVAPTAAAQSWVADGRADLAVVVTASHNPARDNGFKLIGPGGRKLDDASAAALLAARGTPERGRSVDVTDAVATHYLDLFRSRVDLPRRPILVDLARGAWSAWGQRAIGPDRLLDAGPGLINDGVGSEHTQRLRAARSGAAIGIAVDGDGDRVVLVDEAGDVVPGDALIGLLASRSGAASLVVTVLSSRALEASLPGVTVRRVAVGDRQVRAEMDATGAPLGGEESGHVLRADLAGGDGLLVGLWAVSLLGDDALRDAVRPFRPWPRAAGRVAAQRRPPLAEVAGAVAEADAVGRALVRWSGTEPVLRWMVEGPDAAAVGAAGEQLSKELAAWLG